MAGSQPSGRGIRLCIGAFVALALLVLSGTPGAQGDLGTRLSPYDLQRFDYDVEDVETGFLPPSQTGLRQEGSREVRQVRMAHQYGLAYLPLMVARQYKLIEKRARQAGLGELRVTWARFPSGESMRDALLTGFLDFGTGGLPPLLRIWDETHEDRAVRGVAALSAMPVYLNTTNASVRSAEDFGEGDRIALPAVRTSTQAIILQMLAADIFGPENYQALDPLTVAMSHPRAYQALLTGSEGVTAHLGSPPYQYQELDGDGVRKVLSSYDVLGGITTLSMMWTRRQFYEENPRTYQAILDGLREAIALINTDAAEAARVYILQSGARLSEEYVAQIIRDPSIQYSIMPENVLKFASFMHATGEIQRLPGGWQELFFPPVYAGSTAGTSTSARSSKY